MGRTVLKWFKSFLANSKFSVTTGNITSSTENLAYGVPQGSVLSPALFSLYMLSLGSVFRKHGVFLFTKIKMFLYEKTLKVAMSLLYYLLFVLYSLVAVLNVLQK